VILPGENYHKKEIAAEEMTKKIVITGSSRGIGFGLAQAFLEKNCAVSVSGKSKASTNIATEQLREKFSSDKIFGYPCDVRDQNQVQALWDATIDNYDNVDIWINNAGVSGSTIEIWKINPEETENVVVTNLLGAVYGSQVAIKGMLNQGFGSIYNLEGAGSDGRMHKGTNLYGTTKYGLKFLTDALAKELDNTPITIGALRPGMVITDLVLNNYINKPEEWKKVERIFYFIADRVEVVAPWLTDRILKNKKNGARINYCPTWKLLIRILTSPFVKRDVFSDLPSELK